MSDNTSRSSTATRDLLLSGNPSRTRAGVGEIPSSERAMTMGSLVVVGVVAEDEGVATADAARRARMSVLYQIFSGRCAKVLARSCRRAGGMVAAASRVLPLEVGG